MDGTRSSVPPTATTTWWCSSMAQASRTRRPSSISRSGWNGATARPTTSAPPDAQGVVGVSRDVGPAGSDAHHAFGQPPACRLAPPRSRGGTAGRAQLARDLTRDEAVGGVAATPSPSPPRPSPRAVPLFGTCPLRRCRPALPVLPAQPTALARDATRARRRQPARFRLLRLRDAVTCGGRVHGRATEARVGVAGFVGYAAASALTREERPAAALLAPSGG